MPVDVATVKVGAFIWRQIAPINRVKRALNKRRKKKGKSLLKINGEQLEIEEMKLRTSTAAGLAAVLVNIILQGMGLFEATGAWADSPQTSAILTPVITFIVARFWKTPAQPGPV